MSSSTTVVPNGDGTKTGWTGVGDTSNLYANVDEGTASPNDTDYTGCGTGAGALYLLLQNMPVDFVTARSVIIRVRLSRLTSKGANLDYSTVSIVKADESTALTANGTISGQTSTPTTNSVSPSITGSTDKSSWDGARLKIGAPTGSSGSLFFYAAQVEITYDVAAAGRIHRAAMSLDGIGGVGQQRFNPPLCQQSIWTPKRNQIYVPAFCLAK